MVGNDVVDLRDRDADPATLHPRFDARVFAAAELSRVRADAAATLRWRLWAAKEAAYKALKKSRPELGFSPARLRVDLGEARDGRASGVVTCGAARCDVRVDERDGVVHAVATIARDAGRRVVHGALRADPYALDAGPDAPGRLARAFASSRLAAALGVDRDALAFRKRGRIPELWLDGRPSGCDLSLSHHGGAVAFACEVPSR